MLVESITKASDLPLVFLGRLCSVVVAMVVPGQQGTCLVHGQLDEERLERVLRPQPFVPALHVKRKVLGAQL